MNDRERRILEMQAPSTRACLERSPDLDFTWLNRKIDFKKATCLDDNGEIFVNPRPITFQEAKIEAEIRYTRGAKLAEIRNEPDACSITKKKMSAIEAFMDKLTIKDKFAAIMSLFKKEKTYAEVIADKMRKLNEE